MNLSLMMNLTQEILKHWFNNLITKEQFAQILNSVLIAMSSRLIESKDFMHLDRGGFHLNKVPINIKNACNEVLDFFSALASMQATPFSVEVSDYLPPLVVFDRDRLQQILCALLTNAIRFSNSKPVRLILEADISKKKLVVTVHD